MKLSEIKKLNEMPYELDGKMARISKDNSFISNKTLQRNYDFLGLFETGISDDTPDLIELHFLSEKPYVIGTLPDKDRDGDESNRIVFELKFKDDLSIKHIPEDLDESKLIQVTRVAISQDLEGKGLSSFVYASLVKRGYSILSDEAQFKDGKELWKKMAAKANLRDYKVFVLHRTGYEKTWDDKKVVYDGTNLRDNEIWSRGSDFSKDDTLLLMTK